jgi:molecular chaperone DnaK (HSP70)
MSAKYVLGIDLGTTNSVLAYAELKTEKPEIHLLPIPQLVAAGTLESPHSLPSFTYLPPGNKANEKSFQLPWFGSTNCVVGELARRQSAESPDRTIHSAKSWLCHSKIDRHQAILPWNAPPEVEKLSPVTVLQRYLEHLAAAWKHAFPPEALADQQVVLTVPASFDASARELTREAALAAGLPSDFVLLEEPQAAVYAWLSAVGDRWRKMLKVDQTLLVCDVGGGTTDLTLIGVAEENGELVLRRIAVGEHLLVGGDNMDLALAYHAAQLFEQKGVKLDPWQSVSLWHQCRLAKETLLSANAPEKHTLSVLGRGSKLIGGTVSVELKRTDVAQWLMDGFFPQCAATDKPAKRRASGFQEIGLPYESDTSVTKHIAAFLTAHGSGGIPVHPTHVLFNGGVFKADLLQQRLLQVLGDWSGKAAAKALEGDHDLDCAVARGAAYYAWSKEHGGMRIRGGTARSYYVGIETSGLAIPGAPRPLRALCVVPFGMEEGTEHSVPSGEIGLIVGESAQFRFFSSAVRKTDQVGQLLSAWTEDELAETDSLEATLPADESGEQTYVPVKFQSRVTELGVFELWCASTTGDRRWKLEFSVRDEDA